MLASLSIITLRKLYSGMVIVPLVTHVFVDLKGVYLRCMENIVYF